MLINSSDYFISTDNTLLDFPVILRFIVEESYWGSDVFILSEHRGKGLGKWLVNTICEHPDLRDLKRVTLITRTPEFYEPLSFAVHDPTDIRKFMLRVPKTSS